MMITNIQGMRACLHSSLKTKKEQSFKGKTITRPLENNQSMTQEQKTWVGVGLGFEFKLL